MGVFTPEKRLPEVVFNLEKDFEKEVFENYQLFFGDRSVLLETKTLIQGDLLGGTIPDGFLFDLNDPDDPQFYLIEVELSKHSFNNHIFPQITKFFSFFKNQKQRKDLTNKLYEVITQNQTILGNFRKLIGNQEIFKFVTDVIENSQNILIILDGDKREIAEMGEVYHDTWGKLVRKVVIRKFSDSNEIIFQMEPDFEILEIGGDENVLDKPTNYDESHHTEGIPDEILSLYNELKSSLLNINGDLVFNPTKYYVSVRTNKNVSFIKLTKKYLRIVVLRPEPDIREIMGNVEIKTFTDGVKKFWGGDCAAVILTPQTGLDNSVNLIEPLII